ncbi:MAG: Mur ligase domain-containing protein, partial [Microlunatus sp.]|nr:Mur ligase domain-containing protein [Microlunatus sp.]
MSPPNEPAGAPKITGVTADSRLVHPGDLYVAAPGATAHGADYAGEAFDLGAVAVLTD